jgi:hypothetical protein
LRYVVTTNRRMANAGPVHRNCQPVVKATPNGIALSTAACRNQDGNGESSAASTPMGTKRASWKSAKPSRWGRRTIR